ncbi:MAG: isochorismatase family protein, partial [Planctomycetes bacterium]|nr:isochorismatase family protein [Planctomycetota bacterium]
MGNEGKAAKWDRVLIDVCTQRDFLDPGAILQVANRAALVSKLKHIFDWARRNRIGVCSSVESHRPSEPLAGFPLHCIDGTPGQAKPEFAYLHPWILVEVDNSLSLPPDLRENYHQLIFRKRARDVLSNPKADRFLTQFKADEFIIFGVGLERAIRCLALGLLARHKPVTVVSDACGYWSAPEGDLALRQLAAKHIRLVTAQELIAPPPPPTRSKHPLHRPILSRCCPGEERTAKSRRRHRPRTS